MRRSRSTRLLANDSEPDQDVLQALRTRMSGRWPAHAAALVVPRAAFDDEALGAIGGRRPLEDLTRGVEHAVGTGACRKPAHRHGVERARIVAIEPSRVEPVAPREV